MKDYKYFSLPTFAACDARGIINDTLSWTWSIQGPVVSTDDSKFWSDETIYENGPLNAVEITSTSGKIRAIRSRYSN